ncbi:MAG: glycosyltransferase family 2 protein [Desulfobacteraceae bacterium]|nr:MAG: glycosyltransferase family 2 protein [Desulfobacteraceae bacterium]
MNQNHHNNLSYVLITPARNEEAYVEQTIQSVISQTVLPRKWVIVSDGSTDRTDEIVKKYVIEYSWLELIRMPEHRDRQFAAKVSAFNAGYEKVKDLKYDIIGNLDADISFGPDYFEFLLSKFQEDPSLGVAGTPFVEEGKHYDYRFTNIEHVSGACQMFRRKCFEEIGGYVPIKGGGIDWVAVTTARMKGWKTRTFTDKTCRHHRTMGTGNVSANMIWFRQGRKDYFLGNHPLWEIFRSIYQMTKKPIIIGGSLIMLGFIWSAITGMDKPIPAELERFIRSEQMQRLKKALKI